MKTKDLKWTMLLLSLMMSRNSFGQIINNHLDDIKISLQAFNIRPEDFIVNLQPASPNYSFNYTVTREVSGTKEVMACHFNPGNKIPWSLESYNGKLPSKSENKLFKKRVKGMANKPVKIEEQSMTAQKRTYYVILTFRPDSASIPPLYEFLRDCNGKAFINTSTGVLEKITYENFRATRYAGMKVSTLQLIVNVERTNEGYRTLQEWYEMTTIVNGAYQTATETVNYSNYLERK